MTNWKEQFDKEFDNKFGFLGSGITKTQTVKDHVSVEIIEKLIEDANSIYGSVQEWGELGKASADKELRNKWL